MPGPGWEIERALLIRLEECTELLAAGQILEGKTLEEIWGLTPTKQWLEAREWLEALKGDPAPALLLEAQRKVRQIMAELNPGDVLLLRGMFEDAQVLLRGMFEDAQGSLLMTDPLNDGPAKDGPQPPARAEQLLTLALPAHLLEPIVGDLADRFPRIQHRHGRRFAALWYWRQVVGSILRLIPVRALKWASAGAFIEVLRRAFSR